MKKILITLLLLVSPLFMAFLLKLPVFSFALGKVDAWIGFWGSYLGALIGAFTVYLVTYFQIQAQRSIQLESIRNEHENAAKREMDQFYFKNQIDKIEECYSLVSELIDTITKCSNDFTKYITYTHAIYGGQDTLTDEQRKDLEEQIRILRVGLYDWIFLLTSINFKLHRLPVYIEGTSEYIEMIGTELNSYIENLKKGYRNNYSFQDYLVVFDSSALHQQNEMFFKIATNFLNNILEPKLKLKVKEMTNS